MKLMEVCTKITLDQEDIIEAIKSWLEEHGDAPSLDYSDFAVAFSKGTNDKMTATVESK